METEKLLLKIVIKGHLDTTWSTWLNDVAIVHDLDADGKPVSMISGSFDDEAALRNLIAKVRNIGVSIVSINPVVLKEGE